MSTRIALSITLSLMLPLLPGLHAAAPLPAVAPPGDFAQALGRPVMDRLYENRLECESDQWLGIYLFNVPVDHALAAEPTRYTVVSPDDPAYAQAKQVHPIQVGSRTRAARVPLRKEMLVKQTVIFLKLPQPISNGRTYQVLTGDLGVPVPAIGPVTFDDQHQITDNIRLNQLGYLPDYPKRAYLGQYLGSAPGGGALDFGAPAFEVLDRDGKAVFTGKCEPRKVNDELVGQIVYELDFTSLASPGEYRLRVTGVGVSAPFAISAQALTPLFTNLMRGHYHQRCGMAIEAAYSRHARQACHLDDAFLDDKAEKLGFVKPKQPPLYATDYDGKQHKATHGHHDAGDYGKYTVTGAQYVFSALHAMELFPDHFREDNLGLPYSGNGIADLLDEVRWELDWLENMQDATDGGVFGVIKPNTGGYEQHMPPAESHRYFYPKDTVFTAAYAGALARAARSPLIRQVDPQAADRYLAKARKAWQWLEKNQRYVEYFHYGAIFGDWDERCWAAAELYAATGEEAYHRYFLEHFDAGKKRWDWWPLVDAQGSAALTYAFLKDRPTRAVMHKACQDAIRQACQMHLEDSAAHPYRLSMPVPSIRHGQYGWYFPGDLAGYDLLMGYALDKDRRYLEAALDNLHYIAGANPFGYFLQTGLGAKRNIEVVDQESVYDDIIEPVPGLPLGIGSAGFYWLNLYGKSVGEGVYPADWPLMNRWYDGFNVQTEFTMGPMMRETIVAAFFADLGKAQTPPPQVKIKADKLSGTAPFTVEFSIDAHAADGQIHQVFWDFGDESFSTAAAPKHAFTEAGRSYRVAVTVLDQRGLSAYDQVTVNCLLEKPPFPQQARQADEQTVALFAFDGDLRDKSGHELELKPQAKLGDKRRGYGFSDEAPTWMAKPTGQCLVLDGAEHFTAIIPAKLVPKPAETAMTLEMMLYLEEFAGWGYEGDPVVLGLVNRWDSMLAWKQDTWDRNSAPAFGKGISSERFAKEFPRRRWTLVQIVYDGKGSAEFLVDRKSWGTVDKPLLPEANEPLTLHLGPFRGRVDELQLRLEKP